MALAAVHAGFASVTCDLRARVLVRSVVAVATLSRRSLMALRAARTASWLLEEVRLSATLTVVSFLPACAATASLLRALASNAVLKAAAKFATWGPICR